MTAYLIKIYINIYNCISKSVYPVYLYFQIRSLYLYRRGVVWATPLALEHKKTTAIVPGAQDAGHGGLKSVWDHNLWHSEISIHQILRDFGVRCFETSPRSRGLKNPPHVAMDFGQSVFFWANSFIVFVRPVTILIPRLNSNMAIPNKIPIEV